MQTINNVVNQQTQVLPYRLLYRNLRIELRIEEATLRSIFRIYFNGMVFQVRLQNKRKKELQEWEKSENVLDNGTLIHK